MRLSSNSDGERRLAATFCAGALFLLALYGFTLGHGYYNDDFGLARLTVSEWLKNPLAHHGRPVWTLSFAITNPVSAAAPWHHAVNLALFGAVAALCAWLIRSERLPPICYLLALAALCHPAMVWPVSWISQRNDLLLLLFTIPALRLYLARGGVAWVLLSCWSKAPFVFQGFVFAYRYLRRGRIAPAGLATLASAASLYFAWRSYYVGAAQPSGHGLFLAEVSGPAQALAVAALRGVKILEGLLYTFVPLPAYATGAALVLAVSAALAALWGYLAWQCARNWRAAGDGERRRFRSYASVGLSLAIPYAFGAGLRIYVPATLFLCLALGVLLPDRARTRAALGAVAALYLLGVALNFGAVRTGYRDLAQPVISEPRPVPAEKWNALRTRLVDRFVRRSFPPPAQP